jgi:peptidoglycan/LPS O-acetylase OafA/YrhL
MDQLSSPLTGAGDCFKHRNSAFAAIGAVAIVAGMVLMQRPADQDMSRIIGSVLLLVGLAMVALALVAPDALRSRTGMVVAAGAILVSVSKVVANWIYSIRGLEVPMVLYGLVGVGFALMVLAVVMQRKGRMLRTVSLLVALSVVLVGGVMWTRHRGKGERVKEGRFLFMAGLLATVLAIGLC